jgi:hypothetical protein
VTVVRAILGVDEATASMTFAGDVPQGAYARLMKANVDRLIDGAMGAAEASQGGSRECAGAFALLISWVGRNLVLRQRTERSCCRSTSPAVLASIPTRRRAALRDPTGGLLVRHVGVGVGRKLTLAWPPGEPAGRQL